MPMLTEPLAIGFGVQFYEAIKAAQQRGVVLPDVYYGELQGLARQQAFSIAGIAALDQLEQVRNSLSAGLQRGISFKKWQKEMLENGILELPEHRLDNIFRTNIQSNYNRGRWEKIQRNKQHRPYLMYDAINDSRVRPAHLALDGVIKPADDSFWNAHAPLNGYRCRCRLISLTEKQAQARSGQDKGLNKTIKLSAMKPDKGWDYNPGADLTKGINKAIKSKPESKVKDAAIKRINTQTYIPVANAFSLPKSGNTKRIAKSVLEKIDRIHGDGVLPTIPIKSSTSKKFQGVYRHFTHDGTPHSIAVSKISVNPELTVAHEIGHFLDHQGLYLSGKFGSELSPAFEKWRNAIDESDATKAIISTKGAQAINKDYYLTRREQWARSYAQWIAVKSKDKTMISQISNIVNDNNKGYSNSQWKDHDFTKISQEIDDIFKNLGWLK